MLVFIFSTVFLSMAHAQCEHGRAGGLFENGFTNTGTATVAPETGEDASSTFGDTADITFTNQFKIFSTTGMTSVKIHDHGLLLFSGTTTTQYDGTLDVFGILNQAFATPLWFKDDSGLGTPIQYRFKYSHLLASSLVSNGLSVGHSQSECDLQRIVNIIGDCTDNGWRTATETAKEALIVTWEISDGTTKYYFQGVLAVLSNDDTYVIFLYDDPKDIPATVTAYSTGYISGNTAASPTKNAGVCPYSGTTLNTATSRLAKESNCRCGKQTEGIYTFKTNDGGECSKTKADFNTECARDITTDNTLNFDMNCRPPRNPQDSCLEQVSCRDTDAGFEVSVNVLNPPHTTATSIRFLDQTAFGSGTITENTAANCEATLTKVTGTTHVYRTTFTLAEADVGDCDWTYNSANKEISFVARIFDNGNTELERAGNIYLKATCDLLPKEITVNGKSSGIASYKIPTPSDRRVVMFLSSTRIYDNAVDTTITTLQTLSLGYGIFINVGYDWGSTSVVDKVHPYGIYVYDCKVANNEDFLSTGTNRMVQLTNSVTGCVESGLTSDKAFHMAESFKVALKNGASSVGIVDDTDTSTYNFVQSAASFEASKWLVGGSDYIYIQCKAKFCRNQAFKTSSKCWDVCGNHPNVDYTLRKKRDVNDNTTDIDYPEVTLQTSIRVVQPPEAEEKMECVSNVLAYSTMLALTVLLLAAMGVTLMLFVKLQARQRKRT